MVTPFGELLTICIYIISKNLCLREGIHSLTTLKEVALKDRKVI